MNLLYKAAMLAGCRRRLFFSGFASYRLPRTWLPIFATTFFLLPFFPLSREINVFPLFFVFAWSDVSDNEGIIDRPAKGPRYSERFISVYPAKRSFSGLVFAGTSQSTVMVFRFPQRALGGKD